MGKRRSEREQREIVAAWLSSGMSASAFVAKRGVSEASLFRWARLHRSGTAPRAVELVEAVPMDGGERAGWAWELETSRGTLRGREELDGDRLRAIVGVLGGAAR